MRCGSANSLSVASAWSLHRRLQATSMEDRQAAIPVDRSALDVWAAADQSIYVSVPVAMARVTTIVS